MSAFLLFLIGFVWAQTEDHCQDLLLVERLVDHHDTPIFFPKVEVFRRNNGVGVQQEGTMRFVRWAELTFELPSAKNTTEPVTNMIGLTQEGRVFHLVMSGDRTLARLLSGDLSLSSFELSNKGSLIAWDQYDKAYAYEPQKWNQSPIKKILQRWAQLWAGTTAPVLLGTATFVESHYLYLDILSLQLPLPLIEIYAASLVALSSGFAMISKYDHLNTYPNGFVPIESEFLPGAWLQQTGELKAEASLAHFETPDFNEISPRLEQTESIR